MNGLQPYDETQYAYLPDELLEDILEGTPAMSAEVQRIFEKIINQRARMRQALLDAGRVRRATDLENVPSPSVAAVDGGVVVEKSIGADMVLVVAVGVEGLTREDLRKWTGIQYSHWQQVLPHGGEDARRFGLGVMAALEMVIAAQAPHDIVIFDGSHLTPVIGLNSMLSLKLDGLGPVAASILTEYKVVTMLERMMSRSGIVAMVKYDASRELSLTWLSEFGTNFDDRTVMTMLLEPDEYTQPVPAGQTQRGRENWEKLHITIAYPDFPNKDETQQALERALAPVRKRRIYITYYKPYEWSPAYRIELKQEAARSSVRLARVLKAVKEQVVSPEIREPYPQYLADMMAKSVGSGMHALRSAVAFELADTGADRYLRMIAQSYRTER